MGTFLLWLTARLWWTSDTALTFAVITFGACLGLAAANLRARSVDAPVIRAKTEPALVEGWMQDVEPVRKVVRLRGVTLYAQVQNLIEIEAESCLLRR